MAAPLQKAAGNVLIALRMSEDDGIGVHENEVVAAVEVPVAALPMGMCIQQL